MMQPMIAVIPAVVRACYWLNVIRPHADVMPKDVSIQVIGQCVNIGVHTNYGKVSCIRPLPAIKGVNVRHGDGSIRLD